MRAQEVTKTKAAGVKEISERFVSLSFFSFFCCGWESCNFEALHFPV